MRYRIQQQFLAVLFIFAVSGSVYSASSETNNSPYDVVYNHSHYLKKGSYDELKASESFNIPNRKKRINAAITLQEVIYGKGVDLNNILNKIPDDPNYTDSVSRRQIYVLYDKLPQVYVEKTGDKWYYSQATLDALPQLHKKIYPFGTNIWANWFTFRNDEKFLKLYPWQWVGLGIITLGFILSFLILRYLFRILFHKIIFRKYVNEIQDIDKIKGVSSLFSVWVGIKVLQIFIPTLFISQSFALPIIRGIAFVGAFFMVVIIYKLVELFIFYLKKYAQATASQWDDQIVLVLQKFLKFLVIFAGLFYVLNTLDVNVATIIAGLSVGGLALALAAQDTVKNFIASVMIFIDKPFKIGDTIKGDNFEGSVQEVGFRSTRIKTSDDSLVYIANAKLSEMTIDNKGYRVFKKFKTELALSYDTPLHVVERFLEGIKTILLKYPYTKNATIDVYLSNIQASGMMVTISYTYKFYSPREEFLHREFILLSILRLADILRIKLFEQHQILIDADKSLPSDDKAEDIDHRLEKFFVEFDSKVKLSK